jgi:hypothetical protein
MADDGKVARDPIGDLARRAGVRWEPSASVRNELVRSLLARELSARFDEAERDEEDAAEEAGKETGLNVTRSLSPAKVLDFIGVDPSRRSEWEDTFGRLWGRDSIFRIISHHLQSFQVADDGSK